MAKGGWEQERLDLQQGQWPSMTVLLAPDCGGEGARVWLNEASVISRSGALLGYTSHPPPLPVHLVSLASPVHPTGTTAASLCHWLSDGGLSCQN